MVGVSLEYGSIIYLDMFEVSKGVYSQTRPSNNGTNPRFEEFFKEFYSNVRYIGEEIIHERYY